MSDRQPVNILLVDDQPAKLLSYEVILSELGDNLLVAGSGQEALQHLLKNDVAVVLIDVIMPELDGFELAAMIRDHPRFRRTAIIFVSALALTDLDRLKGYEYGAVDYVPVPVVPDLLRAKVRVFAELYRKTRQLERLNAELERRVDERTAELAQANADLERRVEERTREREVALAKVHEMQKLESLGQLTGGVAHDFNNLLMAILGNLDLLAQRMPNDGSTRRLIEGAIKAAERGATLTRRMLAFARRQELRPEAVDVARLINGMADMLRRALGPTIEIATEYSDPRALARVDPNQLELAILNLSLNGRDAMPEGGQLAIAVKTQTVGDGEIDDLAGGTYVSLAVTDSGTGMDEVTLKRAAEPFFTTKDSGKGTGLGLSMVYGLAAQSGGLARMSSQPGQGTTVELWLPMAERPESTQPRPTSGRLAAAAAPSTVLLVDDDPLVAAAEVAMLEQLGHRVVVAASGIAALELVRNEPQIELVITDHAMPGMTGTELASRIGEINPGLPIVLASGYAESASSDDMSIPRLNKPFRLEELASLLLGVLKPQAPPAASTTPRDAA